MSSSTIAFASAPASAKPPRVNNFSGIQYQRKFSSLVIEYDNLKLLRSGNDRERRVN
ncbi:4019_t:CDS:2 [Funneliformis mosseae]|uniref:4019_t:CDS:1 n=1 Tax=Funneliformis mosseae TaxID=27381 RepID=A0A9N8ZKC1_FUNMO|nr:4019_t:CDS:2 [Funneliformis mosseae]